MTRRSSDNGRPYDTYDRYPVSADDTDAPYAAEGRSTEDEGRPPLTHRIEESGSFDLVGEAQPLDLPVSRPGTPGSEHQSRPLSLLRSLFADRLDLLRAALGELEKAERDREQLTRSALDDIDARVAECEGTLRVLRGERTLNDLERRKHLERQLLELKRQRRQEALLSWRDLLSLRREIKSLQRDIASLTGTQSLGGEEALEE